jgi:TetR/AcrR family transcriptional repressor of nem operon
MRAPQSNPQTRQKLLDAAQALMRTKGYTATSVDEICEAAGVTKGSFFHYFEGKEHLGRVVAQHYSAAMQARFQSAPYHQLEDPLDRVYGRVDFFLAFARSPEANNGCLLGTFLQELSATHPGIRAVCADCLAEGMKTFQQDIEAARAKYVPDAKWSAQGLAEHMFAVAQGAIILAKAKQDPRAMEACLMHFREYLRYVFGR